MVSLFTRLLCIFNHFHPGSMLHAMFSGRFDTKPSEDGSYFIDRDGTHFLYILNYLRTGQLIAKISMTSPIVINMPTRELLAGETKNSFV